MEGRERGIVVEMLPRFGHKELHRCVERSADGHQQAEQQRIETVDIVEIDQHQGPPAQSPRNPYHHGQGADGDKIGGMGAAEEVDALREDVGRHQGLLQLTLAHPTLYLLCMGQLHPDAVNAVCWMDGNCG